MTVGTDRCEGYGSWALVRRLWSILCIALLVGCGSSSSSTIIWSTEPPLIQVPATPVGTSSQAQATPHVSPVVNVPDSPEQEHATALVANEPGVYGFVVLEADGTVVASVNSTTPFITASLYKLLLMADIYQRIEGGEFTSDATIVLEESSFDEAGDMYFSYDDIGSAFPLQDYLFAIGAYSSNAAARTLLTLTNPEALRTTAVAIEMDQTYLFTDLTALTFWPPTLGVDASPDDLALAQSYLEQNAVYGLVNVTTPLDMARYQLALLNGTLISPWVSEQIAAILEQQLIGDRIPFYFGDEIRVLNKPGNLDDAVHDVGVLYLSDGPRAIAMLAQAVPDTKRTTLIEQRLALIASGAEEIPPMLADIGRQSVPAARSPGDRPPLVGARCAGDCDGGRNLGFGVAQHGRGV